MNNFETASSTSDVDALLEQFMGAEDEADQTESAVVLGKTKLTDRVAIQNWEAEQVQSNDSVHQDNQIRDLETEINKFFDICQQDVIGQTVQVKDNTDDAEAETPIVADHEQGYAINKRSKMTKRVAIQNWDVQQNQQDSGEDTKLVQIKDLETEINKFFDICQQNEKGKFVDIYPESDTIIIDSTLPGGENTEPSVANVNGDQEAESKPEIKLTGLSSLNLNETSKQLGEYTIIQTLSKNALYKVKLVQNAQGQQLAMKILSQDMSDAIRQKVKKDIKFIQELPPHKNLIKIHESKQGTYVKTKPNGQKEEKQVDYIVHDLGHGGELFDYLASTGGFQEKYARFFFKQLLNALDFCHRNGISHGDLKPENLILDLDFNIQIADFGLSDSKLASPYYMAPEVHAQESYQTRPIDMFAAGVILFIMVAQHPPFTTAEQKDHFYKLISQNKADSFWRVVCDGKENGLNSFSGDFKELLQGMFQQNVNHRPSLSEVLTHPWTLGETATKEDVFAEFNRRSKLVEQQVLASQQQKAQQQKFVQANYGLNTQHMALAMRSDQIESTIDSQPPSKLLEKYTKTVKQKTQFFSTCSPDVIEQALTNYLQDKLGSQLSDLKLSQKKYKISFKLTTQGQSDVVQESEMCVKILATDHEIAKYCVDFQKVNGDLHSFQTHYRDIMKNALNFANDAILSE